MATRTGKIARLPYHLRLEVNRRLLDNQTASILLPWINSQPEAIALWEREFDGIPASDENLSQWRKGGFQEWKIKQDRADGLAELSDTAVRIAKSGTGISDALATMLGGHIMEAFEVIIHADEGAESPDDPIGRLDKISSAVKKIRDGDLAAKRLALDEKKTDQKDRQLDQAQEKMELQTVSHFMKFAKTPAAIKILNSGNTQEIKMEALRELMFGKVKTKEVEP